MVVARSCCTVPMTSPVLAIFIELTQARQHGEHVRARHRELRRAQTVERMAERVDAVAVDVGDRAGGAELQVAAHERDADRIAGPQRRAARRCADARGCDGRAPAITGTKP